MFGFWKKKEQPKQNPVPVRQGDTVILRDVRNRGDIRHLSVTKEADGSLKIEGQDIGDGVEE